MKYKIGNKVKVKKDLKVGSEFRGRSFVASMEKYKDKTAIIAGITHYGDYKLVADNNEHTWTKEMLEPVEFTKDDLKVGYAVELRNKERFIVLPAIDGLTLFPFDKDEMIGGTYLLEYEYNDQLKDVSGLSDYDIVRVYDLPRVYDCVLDCHYRDVIWEREEIKEVTMQELEKHYGCKVKIVDDNA